MKEIKMGKDTTKTKYDIPESIFDSLSEYFPEFIIAENPKKLSGGFLNFVWRIKNKKTTFPDSFIVKWAPPYIAFSPEIPLPESRILIEASAMELFVPGGDLESITDQDIRVPYLYKLDRIRNLLYMEDIGVFPNLSEWMQNSHTLAEAKNIGSILGRFIGTLHLNSFNKPFFADTFDNNSIQKTRLELLYKKIETFANLIHLPEAKKLGFAAANLGESFIEPGSCLIMGDLWPASIIVTDSGLRIFDWELANYGHPSQDIGHFASHLWMHWHRAKTLPMVNAVKTVTYEFMKTYFDIIDPIKKQLWKESEYQNCSKHFGCEIFARTLGPFKKGYLYEALTNDDPIIMKAVRYASVHILNPKSSHEVLDDIIEHMSTHDLKE